MEILYLIIISILSLLLLWLKWNLLARLIKQVINGFKRLNGFVKKLISIAIFILTVSSLYLFFYSKWYDNHRALPKHFEVELKDIIESKDSNGNVLFTINPNVIKDLYHSDESEKWAITSILIYMESKSGFASVYWSIAAIFVVLFGFYKWSAFEKYSLLHMRSKDRIKILNQFSSKHDLIGNRSIYNTIINILDRCINIQQSSINASDTSLKLLLCSPLLDYEGRTTDIGNWGSEFRSKIESIANSHNQIKDLQLFCLPNRNVGGYNPLKNFTEILANFYSSDEVSNSKSLNDFNTIWDKTTKFTTSLEGLDNRSDRNIQFNRVLVPDIPFQIVIYKSKNLKEVIVSFAGKKILEDASKSDPYGFHSVDIDVVDTFEKIFMSYVKEKHRRPIKPSHTQKIIEKIKGITNEYEIKDYLKIRNENFLNEKDIGEIKLKVKRNLFTPDLANSSKFTSYVLKSIICKDDQILEIGAGIGTQSIISYQFLKALGSSSPQVYSVESEKEPYELLKHNIGLNDLDAEKDIIPIFGELKPVVRKYSKSSSTEYALDEKGQRIYEILDIKDNQKVSEKFDLKLGGYLVEIFSGRIEFENKNFFDRKFTLVIGDVPYVDTSSSSTLERAFYDTGHTLHKTLLKFFKNSPLIEPKASLITTFSSLGGEDDIMKFEMLIGDSGLYISSKHSFIEDDYEWIVYVIRRDSQFDWRSFLNCKEPQLQKLENVD